MKNRNTIDLEAGDLAVMSMSKNTDVTPERESVCSCVNDCQNESLKGWESGSVGEGLLCKQDDMGLFPRDCIKKLSTAAYAMYRLCMYTITLVLGRKKQEGPWGLLAETGLAETGCTSNKRGVGQ